METIKVERSPEAESEPPPPPPDVCRLCLSADRRTGPVESLSYAYGLMTDWAPQGDARVCWECRAVLRRVLRFKLQATRALQVLESAQGQVIEDNFSFGSFSRLGSSLLATDDSTLETDFDTYPICKILSGANNPTDTKDVLEVQIHEYGDSEPDHWAENEQKFDGFAGKVSAATATTSATKALNAKSCKIKVTKKDKTRKKKLRKTFIKSEVLEPAFDAPTVKAEKFYATKEDLASYHERALAQLKIYQYRCLSCVAGYKVEDKFKAHNEKYHSEAAGSSVCEVCACRFPTAEALSRHRRKHATLYRCAHPGCRFVHPVKLNITNHYGVHDTRRTKYLRNKDKPKRQPMLIDIYAKKGHYECNDCGKVFKIRRDIAVHVKRHARRIMCEICGKKCATLYQMKSHMYAHLDPSHRPFECSICHNRFIDRYKLTVHLRVHSGERPFPCDICEKAFISKEELSRHKKMYHSLSGTMKKSSAPRTKSFHVNKTRFSQAPLQIKRDYKITKHLSDKYQCNVCEKKFMSYSHLQAHFVVHEDKKPSSVTCSVCNKQFKYTSQMQVHLRMVHSGERPFQCVVCGASFASKHILNNHLHMHSDAKNFKCDECGQAFKYASALYSHKLIHKGEKPHQCTICGSRFTLKGNLTGHMKTHTNERPFECNVCGKKFPWKRNLRNHFKTHSKEQRILELQTSTM